MPFGPDGAGEKNGRDGGDAHNSGRPRQRMRGTSSLTILVRCWPWLGAIVSGLLCAACFPSFDQEWLCWICLAPLIAAIWFSGHPSKRKWLRDLLLGYLAGLIFFWSVFSWLTTVTVLGWFLLSFYMAIYFALWGWFCGLCRPREIETKPPSEHARPGKWEEMLAHAGREPASTGPVSPWLKSTNNLRLAFLLAAAWTTGEWLRGWVLSGFGWNGLGVALHRNWLLIQVAEFTGVLGLSFAVSFCNVIAVTTIRRLVLEAGSRRMKPHYDLTLTMSGIIGLLALGWNVVHADHSSKPIQVAAVQANIPRSEKFDQQFAMSIFDRFDRLSRMALQTQPPPALLVWPESSMPGPVLEEPASHDFVMNLAATAGIDILLGTIDVEGSHDYNAAVLVSEGGENVQLYRKLHLVPFGEYVPGRYTVPLIARIVGDQVPGDFDVGNDYAVFGLTDSNVFAAPLICFEDTIGELTRNFVLRGANLLVNVTNDGWFLRSAGSQQHLANAIFRCAEMHRPMVRAANTGVTCFVNEFGRVTQILRDEHGDTFGEGILAGQVNIPMDGSQTFYVRHGDLFARLCASVTVAALFFNFLARLRRRRVKRQTSS